MARKTKIERFNEKVLSRFQIYNSLFLTLPFKTIKQTSLLMPLFAEHCRIEYEKNSNTIMEAIRSGNFVYDVSGSAR